MTDLRKIEQMKKTNALQPTEGLLQNYLYNKKIKKEKAAWEKKHPAKYTSNGVGVGP